MRTIGRLLAGDNVCIQYLYFAYWVTYRVSLDSGLEHEVPRPLLHTDIYVPVSPPTHITVQHREQHRSRRPRLAVRLSLSDPRESGLDVGRENSRRFS